MPQRMSPSPQNLQLTGGTAKTTVAPNDPGTVIGAEEADQVSRAALTWQRPVT
jgi:hypothetical protein